MFLWTLINLAHKLVHASPKAKGPRRSPTAEKFVILVVGDKRPLVHFWTSYVRSSLPDDVALV